MRKILITVLLLASLPLAGWHALPADVLPDLEKWATSFEFRYSSISIKEYVLSTAPDGSEYIVSRLDWELERVASFGFNFSCRLLPKLLLTIGGGFDLQPPTEPMDDYDGPRRLPAGTSSTTYSGPIMPTTTTTSQHARRTSTCSVSPADKVRQFLGGGYFFKNSSP
jgi:outer membrane protease